MRQTDTMEAMRRSGRVPVNLPSVGYASIDNQCQSPFSSQMATRGSSLSHLVPVLPGTSGWNFRKLEAYGEWLHNGPIELDGGGMISGGLQSV